MYKGTKLNRHKRLRKKISGSADRPRLVATKTNVHMFVQVVDDAVGNTLLTVSTYKSKGGTKTENATKLGSVVAKKALEQNITNVVFDRGGSKYHGRIKAFADAARKEGLKF
jgi:large subunit ribosomal protein L18